MTTVNRCLVVVLCVLSGCGSQDTPNSQFELQQKRIAPNGNLPEQGIDVKLDRRFEVLRRPTNPGDRPPPLIARQSESISYSTDSSTARLIYASGTFRLYVVLGDEMLCLFDTREIVTNCWAKRDVLRGEANVATLCTRNLAPGTIQLAGIVPDSVERVRIALASSDPERTVAARGNVWLATLPAVDPLPLFLHWIGSGWTQRHSTGIPKGVKVAPCGAGGR